LVTSSANYSSAKIAFEPNLFDGDYNYVPDQNFQSASSIQNKNMIKGDFVKDIDNSDKGQSLNTGVNVADKKSNLSEKMSLTKTPAPEKIVKDKSNRQEIILSMLKSGVKLTIKDFAKNIKDCSEKTIQRELLSLVSKGVLKKEGERRWSKYFLIK
jgi:DNA-binding NarL/FixJ family response regulator